MHGNSARGMELNLPIENKESGPNGLGFESTPVGASMVFPLLRWSAGVMECWKYLIPNTKSQGFRCSAEGGSGVRGKNKKTET